MQKYFLYFIILFLSFANSAMVQYLSFLLLALLVILSHLFSSKPHIVSLPVKIKYDMLALSYLVCWLYGFSVGIFSGNKVNYVFSNFAGMVLYCFYFGLVTYKVSKERVLKALLMAATINLFTNFSVKMYQIAFGLETIDSPIITAFLGSFRTGSSTGQMRLLNINQLVVFVLLSVLIYRLFVARNSMVIGENYVLVCNKIQASILALLSVYVLIVMPASKGYMLAVFFLFACYFLIMVFNKSFTMRALLKVFASVVVLCSFAAILMMFNYTKIASAMFSKDDDSNVVRYIQLAELVNDITPLGKGLGAVIPGVTRDDEKPYGFELSYVNLIHKVGFFSLPLFFCYFYSIYKAIANLRKKHEDWRYNASALGALCYLFPSLGNPLLFGPQMVILHCLALYLMRPV